MSMRILIILIMLSASHVAIAQSIGCVSNDTGFMYPNNAYGSTYEPSPVGAVGVGDYCRPTYQGNCRIRSRSNCRNCTGPVNEGTWLRPDYWYYQSGKEYRYVECDIDTNLPYILLSSGVLGFMLLRRKYNFSFA